MLYVNDILIGCDNSIEFQEVITSFRKSIDFGKWEQVVNKTVKYCGGIFYQEENMVKLSFNYISRKLCQLPSKGAETPRKNWMSERNPNIEGLLVLFNGQGIRYTNFMC